jgi:hypothetical protein
MLLESDSGNFFFVQPSPVLLLQTVDQASRQKRFNKKTNTTKARRFFYKFAIYINLSEDAF